MAPIMRPFLRELTFRKKLRILDTCRCRLHSCNLNTIFALRVLKSARGQYYTFCLHYIVACCQRTSMIFTYVVSTVNRPIYYIKHSREIISVENTLETNFLNIQLFSCKETMNETMNYKSVYGKNKFVKRSKIDVNNWKIIQLKNNFVEKT